MRSKAKYLAALLPVGYVLLLVLLTVAERSDPNASITRFSDAFWYSVVTLSTVGYGDLYPVTGFGRLIGACFVLMSMGVLSLVLSFAYNLLTGRILPAVRLWTVRNRRWYVFDEINDETLALAEDLKKQFPDAAILFPQSADRSDGYYAYSGSALRVAAGKKDKCCLLYMGQTSQVGNYKNAISALSLGFPVYCSTSQASDTVPEGLVIFNRSDCCAREYWRREPLASCENTVILIGDGEHAAALLEQALWVNVFCRERKMEYHVFGDWAEFCRNHPNLELTISVNQKSPEMDALYFHKEAWNADAHLLSDAHRIILCSDRDEENLDVLRKLRVYFPVAGKVHIRSGREISGEYVFGLNRQVFTADTVIREETLRIAKTMHQIYREGAGGTAPAWESLTPFLRQSNIAAADHVLTKIRYLLNDDSITEVNRDNCTRAYRRYCENREELSEIFRKMEHLRWMRFHSMYNWSYAPVRNNKLRLHPSMQPYEELSVQEQAKDDYSWELLGSIAERLS